MLDAIAKVCRVLPVGTLTRGDDEAMLTNWLAVLMPLILPQASDAIADPMRELLQSVEPHDPIVSELLAAALRGVDEVQVAFHKLVQGPLDDAELDE